MEALEYLHDEFKDKLGIEIRGDGDDFQMVRTIILLFESHRNCEVKYLRRIAELEAICAHTNIPLQPLKGVIH